MQSWGLQLACQISHCFKSLAWRSTADVETGVPGSGKKHLTATQDVLDRLLQAASRYPRSLSPKAGFYHPIPFPLALVTWLVLANKMRAAMILPPGASLNLFFLGRPRPATCQTEVAPVTWITGKTIWSRTCNQRGKWCTQWLCKWWTHNVSEKLSFLFFIKDFIF